ncbi:MAG TPA: VOC family protein [Ohtaekwangia sp.]|nr:VOC family protein [Ohtaekwangia sp.]
MKSKNMHTSLGRAIILVKDYDEAFDFYEKNFFCRKIFDYVAPSGQRFLHIGFSDDDDSVGVWFLKADNGEQQSYIGKQTAGQPTLVIYTDDCDKLYNHLQANGVTIIEQLVITTGSKFFHCLDLYGNRLTVVELDA